MFVVFYKQNMQYVTQLLKQEIIAILHAYFPLTAIAVPAKNVQVHSFVHLRFSAWYHPIVMIFLF